jgi:hypothetical protein
VSLPAKGNGVSYRTESNDFNDSQNKDDLLRSLKKILIPKQSRIVSAIAVKN